MTAAIEFFPRASGWTTDDLEDLPDDGLRRELLDGVLLVSPSPTDIHQIIAMRLGVALEETCPSDLQVTQGVEIRISPTRSFIPDVLVATDEAARRRGRYYTPKEVVLAVEIVSPTSLAMDRVMKPALYASAGIPYYWRIETTNGIAVHAQELDPALGVYRPVELFDARIRTLEPWPIDIPVKRLTPRHML
ncbi:Uma2 family endonuclease [Actinoplanes sp. DH11]|uniref:Uma2 family endonuclease n=1 Tax=Actinoplanes sp. DH11 TaxID=2857011 RepID=UPI001E637AEB|nr:Uma2 family endonuclease [Actinoplanes sp. DH11]